VKQPKGGKMLRRIFVIISAIITLSVIDTNAQRNRDEAGTIGIGPQIGYQRSGDADAGEFMYGGFFRAKLSNAFGIEASLNYRHEEYANGMITVRSWPVLLSALVYPFPMFYGIAGGGWHHTTIDFDPGFSQQDLADQTSNPFGWHLGAGVEIPMGESVKLTGDVKYVFLDYAFQDFLNTPINDYNNNFYIVNVGLAFGFR
jgi:opacity protein-like surface antigen